MVATKLSHLDTWDSESGTLNVIIETPKGGRNKLKYDSERGLFELSKVLPRGAVFPFDFGFIPSTKGEDGDPLDVLVLMDEPVFPGCKVRCRLIGVIEAEQTTKRGGVVRNDRLIAMAEDSREDQDTRSLKDLPDRTVAEIQHFFASYHELDGKEFKPLASRGPKRAKKLVQEGAKRFRHDNSSQADKEDAAKAG